MVYVRGGGVPRKKERGRVGDRWGERGGEGGRVLTHTHTRRTGTSQAKVRPKIFLLVRKIIHIMK